MFHQPPGLPHSQPFFYLFFLKSWPLVKLRDKTDKQSVNILSFKIHPSLLNIPIEKHSLAVNLKTFILRFPEYV